MAVTRYFLGGNTASGFVSFYGQFCRGPEEFLWVIKGGPDSPLPDVSDVTALLAQAKALHDELEAVYNPHMDFARVYALANAHALRLFKEN